MHRDELDTENVGPGSLSALMDFDVVIRVKPDGLVERVASVHAPEALDPDIHATTLDGWSLMMGYSGQQGYAGPWMHDSELIAGGIARDVLARPGLYVAIYATFTAEDDDTALDARESVIEGWAIAYKLDGEPDGKDVPFEPAFSTMSREQLLDVARRYHSMLAEVEAIAEGSETEVDGGSLQLSSVERAGDATYAVMHGAVTVPTFDGVLRTQGYLIGFPL